MEVDTLIVSVPRDPHSMRSASRAMCCLSQARTPPSILRMHPMRTLKSQLPHTLVKSVINGEETQFQVAIVTVVCHVVARAISWRAHRGAAALIPHRIRSMDL